MQTKQTGTADSGVFVAVLADARVVEGTDPPRTGGVTRTVLTGDGPLLPLSRRCGKEHRLIDMK